MTWINQQGVSVEDHETYTDPHGTCYPGWRKEDIPGLTRLPDPEPEPEQPPPEPTPPTVEQIKAEITMRTQQRLDEFARTRGYDGIKSAVSYVGCSVPRFSSDGVYCRDAMAETWAAEYALMDEVLAGKAKMPTCFADIESVLPVLEWPA